MAAETMPTRTALTRDFFKLEGICPDIDEHDFVALVRSKASACEDRLYRPDKLENQHTTGRLRLKGVTFRNVSFSRTSVIGLEFTDCVFERCLFISTIFRGCRFTSCKFVDCNPHRIEFDACYVEPMSFTECIVDEQYSNIGVYLFQELLRNSRQQAQPDFSDDAQYLFRKWQIKQLKRDLKNAVSKPRKRHIRINVIRLQLFDVLLGSGVRLGRLVYFALSVIILMTLVNWLFAPCFGLKSGGESIGLIDSLYFSTVTTTTLGYGDIAPTTTLGRIVVSIEAIIGFILFALVTSTLYRKFSS